MYVDFIVKQNELCGHVKITICTKYGQALDMIPPPISQNCDRNNHRLQFYSAYEQTCKGFINTPDTHIAFNKRAQCFCLYFVAFHI